MPLSLTIFTSAFPAEKRGAVVGIWGGIAGLAVASGPLIGGGITQALNWHWIFWVNVPIGVAAAVGAALRLPESHGPRARLDVPALVLVSGGVAILIWGLVQGGQDGWGSVAGPDRVDHRSGDAHGFVWWEGRAPEPMLPLGLFRRISFSSAVTTQFFMAAAIFSAAFLTSQFFQFARGDSPLGTGLRFLPWTATPLVIAPIAGKLSDRLGARALIVPGLVMQAFGFGWMVHLAATSAHYTSFVIPFVIAGVGISMALPSVTAGGLNAVPRNSWERRRAPSIRCSSSALSSASPWSRLCSMRTGASPPRRPSRAGTGRPWPCRPAPRCSAPWLPWAYGGPGQVAPTRQLRSTRRTKLTGGWPRSAAGEYVAWSNRG